MSPTSPSSRREGAKVYLSPVVDCFDGMPAAWSISLRPDSELCDSSLLAYLGTLPEGHPPVVGHSDGGCQYRARSWKRICEEGGIVRSMSRKGCCPDNARAEGFSARSRRSSTTAATGRRPRPRASMRWYRDGRLKGFREEGRMVYDTITGRRRRLGYAV
ncbi:MAG: DDE-type integrase/transposase/recombinase [Gordonibacter pamelaeae]